MRNIDPETNWFFKEGYRDGLDGMRPIVPDETRHTFQRSDYFVGYDAGSEDRAAKAKAQIERISPHMCQKCKKVAPAAPPPNTLVDHVLFDLICLGAAALVIELVYLAYRIS